MKGRIATRLLISALVDPDEAAERLPAVLRPHVIDGGGTVVGCCLLDLEAVRPDRVPSALGRSVSAAAHRISVEWDAPEGPMVGVFVAIRHTDSFLASSVGGRLVPGVHHRVPFESTSDVDRLARRVGDPSAAHFMDVVVGLGAPVADDAAAELVSSTCLAATVGLSPGRRRELDAIGMHLAHHQARAVDLERLVSPFVASFASAGEPIARLMSDVDVVWERAVGPGA